MSARIRKKWKDLGAPGWERRTKARSRREFRRLLRLGHVQPVTWREILVSGHIGHFFVDPVITDVKIAWPRPTVMRKSTLMRCR